MPMKSSRRRAVAAELMEVVAAHVRPRGSQGAGRSGLMILGLGLGLGAGRR
jgi:hypothetical protein